jgi:hypothetical protein
LRRHIIEIAKTIGSLPYLQVALANVIRRWQRFALKDKRRTRLSTCRQIELAAAQSLGP